MVQMVLLEESEEMDQVEQETILVVPEVLVV
jgi:hypothetical protein